jgi:L-fucose isomerase
MVKIGIRPIIECAAGGRADMEDFTMGLSKAVAGLIESNVKDREGKNVSCVIADGTISGARAAEECAAKFRREDVCATISVAASWSHPLDTMDIRGDIPQLVWGFDGTDACGAIYMAGAAAAYAQLGIPAFFIQGRDVQDNGDTAIAPDVAQKILRFAKAASAIGQMKGKSFLSIGATSLGIPGSNADPSFFLEYLGMRVEKEDMTGVMRRVEQEIYDKDEYEKAIAWVKEHCKTGGDMNSEPSSGERKQFEWEYVVKMAIVIRDMMAGNSKLAGMGHTEESHGHNALCAGFQGARQWTDFRPNGDFAEAMLNTCFDWNGARPPYILATENDSLNAACMMFGNLLTNGAQMFCDVHTLWTNSAVKRVSGKELPDGCKGGVFHLTNSGPGCLDATGMQEDGGRPAMKPFYDITDADIAACMDNVDFCPAMKGGFPAGGFSTRFKMRGGMPLTLTRLNIAPHLGPVHKIGAGWDFYMPE